jgi:repressor of nif and glnA expression
VEPLDVKMKQIDPGGLVRMGMPGESFLDIPLSEGSAGAIVIGGLNPVSILEEKRFLCIFASVGRAHRL